MEFLKFSGLTKNSLKFFKLFLAGVPFFVRNHLIAIFPKTCYNIQRISSEREMVKMTRNTHLATGLSVAIAAVRPDSFMAISVCIVSATIGSIVSDIDVTTSTSRKELNKIIGISVIAIVAATMLEAIFHIGILSMLEAQTNLYRALLGIVCYLLICVFGITTPHRTFMHSFPCVIALAGTVWLICPAAVVPSSVAMMSHIILDFFNTKKVQILYPLKKPRICFKMCKADGKANKIIGKVFSVIFILEVAAFIAFKLYKNI